MPHRNLLITLPFVLLFTLLSLPAYSSNDEGAIANLRQTGKAFAAVAKQVSPSVVLVQVESKQQGPQFSSSPFGDDLFRRFFGERLPGPSHPHKRTPERRISGQGSGFVFKVDSGVVSSTSYILTNNHVVDGADKVRVTFQDGNSFVATVTGTDPKSDIAVLSIEDDSHPALPLGDSAVLQVGEWVVAVGNPFGLSHTLTVGVVSAKGRSGLGINDYEDFIQTDAAINPGNSGGPLLNLDGEVIGINTAIFSRSGGYMGIGFAIPVDQARNIAMQLIDGGGVTRGYLGAFIQNMSPELAESFELQAGRGILVAQVEEGSPAEMAGLKVGDIITAYQGEAVSDVADFRNRVALSAPGSREKLDILREGKSKKLSVTLGKLEEGAVMAGTSSQRSEKLGLNVQTITPELSRQYDVKVGEGVLVRGVQAGSPAARAGIRQGSVILQVNRQVVSDAEEFRQAMQISNDDKQVLLLVRYRGASRYLVITRD